MQIGHRIFVSKTIPKDRVYIIGGNIYTDPHAAFRIDLTISGMDLIDFVHCWRDRRIKEIENKCNRLIKEPIPFHKLNLEEGEELCQVADTI